MGINEGSNPIASVHEGNTNIAKVYEGSNLVWQAVTAAEYIFVADEDYTIHKIDKDNTQQWTYNTGNYPLCVAVDADGYSYFGDGYGMGNELHKLDPNGNYYSNENWPYTGHSDEIPAVAVDSNGNIFSGGKDTDLHKINPDGSQAWSINFNDTVSAVAVGPNDNVYVGTVEYDNSVYKVDTSGTIKWEYTGHSSNIADLAVDKDGYVYTASWDTECHKIDVSQAPNDGSTFSATVWEYTGLSSVSRGLYSVAVDSNKNAYCGNSAKFSDYEVHKLKTDGSGTVWEYTDHSNTINAIQVDVEGNVYTGSSGNVVHKIASDGTNLWIYSSPTGVVHGLALL